MTEIIYLNERGETDLITLTDVMEDDDGNVSGRWYEDGGYWEDVTIPADCVLAVY